METITDVLQAISTVGFPVVMCLLVFWESNKKTSELCNTLTSMFKELVADIKEMSAKIAEIESRLRDYK